MENPSNWKEEAKAVIKDIENHVKKVKLSKLTSTDQCIYINITTMEDKPYCVELSGRGFRVVGNAHDSQELEQETEEFFETPYSLLSSISLLYKDSFSMELMEKLSKLAEK